VTGEPRFSVLDPGGPQAGHIHDLWNVFWWISVVVWVGVTAMLIVAAVHARRARTAEGEGDPTAVDPAQQRRMVRIVIGASAITVLTLISLLVVSVDAGSALAGLDQPNAVAVRITGHQWWWQIDYDYDSPRRATTANELHVPVGRVVRLELSSDDVIHSFWVPSLHGKKDLVPGRVNVTSIRADQPGVYRGQCAEFCGLQHAKMELTVIAEPPAQFEAWLAHQHDAAPPPKTDETHRGQAVFMTRTCVMCHAIAGTQAGAGLGPDLTHVASRGTLAAGALANDHGHLAAWILDPQEDKPGVRMPSTALTADELRDLVAYLETLR
jgi:cytochrome c oxidase subunit 2